MPEMERSCFNTSHVNVYPLCSLFYVAANIVSIHPMLMFIFRKKKAHSTNTSFNTSHVNVYHNGKRLVRKDGGFNTSHVNVYLYLPKPCTFTNSCFNTSHVNVYQSPMLRNHLSSFGFNTSHVNVYLYRVRISSLITMFQYIPC